MINESKKRDPRFWEKWEKSGSMSTPPQVIERREKEAEAWLHEQYRFINHASLSEQQQNVFKSVETAYKEYDHPNPYKSDVLEKIKNHPVLDIAEIKERNTYDKYGSTNNFWRAFTPETRQRIHESLEKGKLPKDFVEQQVVYWQTKDILFPAFERVGFERIRQMHEAIRMYLELDQEWKQRVGANPMGLPYGLHSIPESPMIPDEEKEVYSRSLVTYINVLRSLAVELAIDGVPFACMHA